LHSHRSSPPHHVFTAYHTLFGGWCWHSTTHSWFMILPHLCTLTPPALTALTAPLPGLWFYSPHTTHHTYTPRTLFHTHSLLPHHLPPYTTCTYSHCCTHQPFPPPQCVCVALAPVWPCGPSPSQLVMCCGWQPDSQLCGTTACRTCSACTHCYTFSLHSASLFSHCCCTSCLPLYLPLPSPPASLPAHLPHTSLGSHAFYHLHCHCHHLPHHLPHCTTAPAPHTTTPHHFSFSFVFDPFGRTPPPFDSHSLLPHHFTHHTTLHPGPLHHSSPPGSSWVASASTTLPTLPSLLHCLLGWFR